MPGERLDRDAAPIECDLDILKARRVDSGGDHTIWTEPLP
jgi:hypothetical protein